MARRYALRIDETETRIETDPDGRALALLAVIEVPWGLFSPRKLTVDVRLETLRFVGTATLHGNYEEDGRTTHKLGAKIPIKGIGIEYEYGGSGQALEANLVNGSIEVRVALRRAIREAGTVVLRLPIRPFDRQNLLPDDAVTITADVGKSYEQACLRAPLLELFDDRLEKARSARVGSELLRRHLAGEISFSDFKARMPRNAPEDLVRLADRPIEQAGKAEPVRRKATAVRGKAAVSTGKKTTAMGGHKATLTTPKKVTLAAEKRAALAAGNRATSTAENRGPTPLRARPTDRTGAGRSAAGEARLREKNSGGKRAR